MNCNYSTQKSVYPEVNVIVNRTRVSATAATSLKTNEEGTCVNYEQLENSTVCSPGAPAQIEQHSLIRKEKTRSITKAVHQFQR